MSRLRQFWFGWRKEIVRGGLIFGAVVVIGLAVTRMFGWLPLGLAQNFRDLENIDFGHSGDDHNRDWQEAYHWIGPMHQGHVVWIRNTNGPVSVEESENDSLIVEADKSARRSDPESVEIRVVEKSGGITFCAVWQAAVMECGAEGEYRMKDQRKSDVAVRFRVFLPKGVKLDASTVNGGVDVAGATAALTLATVNGRIQATSQGPIRANTVNGSIHATMESLGRDDEVELKTVNGSIEAELPAATNGELDASTVSGRVSTELPIQLVGRISPRNIKARLGSGGRRLVLSTVNGSIEITEAAKEEPPEHPNQ